MFSSPANCCYLFLQGAALAELQALFPALAGTGSPAAKTEALLSALLDEGRGRRDGGGSTDGSARQAQHSVAQCCAVLVVPAGQAQVDATVKQLLEMLKSADQGGRWRRSTSCCVTTGRLLAVSGSPVKEHGNNTCAWISCVRNLIVAVYTTRQLDMQRRGAVRFLFGVAFTCVLSACRSPGPPACLPAVFIRLTNSTPACVVRLFPQHPSAWRCCA
jgi:hypothetical protein